MSATADKLLQELLQLSHEEREEIVSRLYEEDAAEIDLGPEWSEEIKRRIENFENGTAQTVSTEELFEYMRAEGDDAED